jgi:hypothetical protein
MLDETNHCIVDDCHMRYVEHFTHSKGWKYYYEKDNTTSYPEQNTMRGSYNEWNNSTIEYSAGDGIYVAGSNNKITNCIIHDVCYSATFAAAIDAGWGETCNQGVFSGNTLYNSGRYVAMFYGARAAKILYNHMYDAMLLSRDGGIAYTALNDGNDTEIAYNWLHDNHCTAGGFATGFGSGLYIDAGSSNYLAHHNVIWDCDFAGIFICSHITPPINLSNNIQLYNNTIYNNITHHDSTDHYGEWGIEFIAQAEGSEVINNLINNPNPATPQPRIIQFQHATPTHYANGSYSVDEDYVPLPFSVTSPTPSAVDAGVMIPNLTCTPPVGAPDIGAYEFEGEYWTPGSSLEIPPTPTPPPPIFMATSASMGWGSNQGLDNWYYNRYSDPVYTPLVWNTMTNASWTKTGGNDHPSIGGNGACPGLEEDAVRTWIAPRAGSIKIEVCAQRCDPTSGAGDGVVVKVVKNEDLENMLWQQTIENTDYTHYRTSVPGTPAPVPGVVTVAEGDRISFHLSPNDTNWYDATQFNAIIYDASKGPAWGASYDYSAGHGNDHWDYEYYSSITLEYAPLEWTGAQWALNNTSPRIWLNGGIPYINGGDVLDAVRTWVAPWAGVVDISGVAVRVDPRVSPTPGAGDGVVLKVVKSHEMANTLLCSEYVDNTILMRRYFNIPSIPVALGDKIRFHINPNVSCDADATQFDAVVMYQPTITPTPTPTETPTLTPTPTPTETPTLTPTPTPTETPTICAPMSLWHLDEGTGMTAADSSGNGNDGTVHGATWSGGVMGGDLSFNGVDDYTEVPDAESLSPREQITVAAWIKVGTFNDFGRIAAKSTWPQYDYILLLGADNNVGFVISKNGVETGAYSIANTIQAGQWYHVTGTYDGRYVRMYINGLTAMTSNATSGLIDDQGGVFSLGRNPANNSAYYSGLMDEVYIYGSALSEEEIRALMQSAIGPWPMFKQRISLTGKTANIGPRDCYVLWSYNVGDIYWERIAAIGEGNRVYIGGANRLYCLNPNGTRAWSYTTNGRVLNSNPAIDYEEHIFFGSEDARIYALNSSGVLYWSYNTGTYNASNPIISEEIGLLYSASPRLYRLNSNGTMRWSYAGEWAQPSLGAGNSVYAQYGHTNFFKLTSNGLFCWSYVPEFNEDEGLYDHALGSDGTVYLADFEKVYSLRSDGGFSWSYRAGSSAITVGTGDRVCAQSGWTTHCLGLAGGFQWSYQNNSNLRYAVIDGEEKLFTGSEDNNVYCLTSDGGLGWSFRLPNKAWNAVIGNDYRIYVGSRDNNLYALGEYTPTAIPTPTVTVTPTASPTP